MMSGSRLDMKHGFIKYITRNQVDRDNYDKAVKAKAAQAKQSKPPAQVVPQAQNRTRKPDLQTYVPPTRLRAPPNGDAKTSEDHIVEVLFRLEYEDQNGEVHNLKVHPTDDPLVLSRRFGQEQGFSTPMIGAFSDFLREEMKKCRQK